MPRGAGSSALARPGPDKSTDPLRGGQVVQQIDGRRLQLLLVGRELEVHGAEA